MPENSTVWKPDNQGVKEETFTQIGRRAVGQRGHSARQWLAECQSHICMRINWEEQLGSETDRATQGSSVGK